MPPELMEKEQLLLLTLQDSEDPSKERPVILVVQVSIHTAWTASNLIRNQCSSISLAAYQSLQGLWAAGTQMDVSC